MSEKLCIFCKRFGYQGPRDTYAGYGEGDTMTSPEFHCYKGHYALFNSYGPETAEGLRSLLELAEHCPDYERPIEGEFTEVKT